MPPGSHVGPIEIPNGRPDAIEASARAWGAMVGGMALQVAAYREAAAATVQADWHGAASEAFAGLVGEMVGAMGQTREAAADLATACTQYAPALRDAQDDARRAARQWLDAEDRREQAEARAHAAAEAAARSQETAAAADRSASAARGAGPAGEPTAARMEHEATTARTAASTARGEQRRHAGLASDAADDQRRAVTAGQRAGDAADDAHKKAAAAFRAAMGGIAKPPAGIYGLPAPITRDLPPQRYFVGPIATRAAAQFAPGHIADERARVREQDRRRAYDAHHNDLLDVGAGFLSGFGIPAGGNEDSPEYRSGRLISFLPIGGLVSITVKVGGKLITRTVTREVAEALARREGRHLDDLAEATRSIARREAVSARGRRALERQLDRERGARYDAWSKTPDGERVLARAERATELGKAVNQTTNVLDKLGVHLPSGTGDVLQALVEHWPTYRYVVVGKARAVLDRFVAEVLR